MTKENTKKWNTYFSHGLPIDVATGTQHSERNLAICADERKNPYYETLIIRVIESLPCSISVNALLAESFTCRGCLVQRTKVPSATQQTTNIGHTVHTPAKDNRFILSSQLHLVADHFHLTDIAVGSIFPLLLSTNCLITRARIAQFNVVITQSA